MADVIPTARELPFVLQPIKDVTVVEFRAPSLMDPLILEATAAKLYAVVDEEDRRKIVLDFEKVQYLSSQAIGILLNLKKKLDKLKGGTLLLCGVGAPLQQLLKITALDRVLVVVPTQKEALQKLLV